MLKNTLRFKLAKSLLFVMATAITLIAGRTLAAQDEVLEDPKCGMGHMRLCKEETTCVGYGGTKRCSTDSYYFNYN